MTVDVDNDHPRHAATGKICSACGLDVARLPRTKDQRGRYYCKPCVSRLKDRNASSSGSRPQRAEPDDLGIPLAGPDEGRTGAAIRQPSGVASGGHRVGSHAATSGAGRAIPDYLQAIAEAERRLLWAIVLSIIPLFHYRVLIGTYQLAKAMGKEPWSWTLASLIPWAGLLSAFVLNGQATTTLRAAGLTAPMFRPWRRA